MESLFISAGFSDIKLHLIQKCELSKLPQELTLWFSLEGGVLYAHDSEDHKKCVAIALREKDNYKCLLEKKNRGVRLFEYAIYKVETNGEDLEDHLNDLNRLHGSGRFY